MHRTLPAVLLALSACLGQGEPQSGNNPVTFKDAGPPLAPDSGTPVADAGAPDAGPLPDAGSSPDGGSAAPDAGRLVPIFVAQGAMGRTTISCDDGQTWVANHSWDLDRDPLVCGSVNQPTCYTGSQVFAVGTACQSFTPCFDSPDVAKGVAFGAGRFVATWGWGPAGVVRESTDGITWNTTHAGSPFGGIQYGAGTFVVASRSPYHSADGLSWTAGQTADFRSPSGGILWSVRRFAFANYQGGRFVAVSDGVVLISADGGQTWYPPKTPPALAGAVSNYGDVLYGNGAVVIVDDLGNAYVSTDGGDTWATHPTGVSQVLSRGVWTGSEFWIWGSGYRLSSPDGVTWTRTAVISSVRLEGAVQRNPLTGTLVAVDNVWNAYSQLRMLRSTDGLTWTSLPAGAFAPSHPLWEITFGYAQPSAACP